MWSGFGLLPLFVRNGKSQQSANSSSFYRCPSRHHPDNLNVEAL